MIFSFYYANNVATFMQSKTDLMKQIKDYNKEVKSVDAVIQDDYIIPGINGLIVNTKDSYSNMIKVGYFDEEYLSFDEIAPLISLQDNLDKIIKKGNSLKKSISIIIDNKSLLKYCIKNNIKANYLVNVNDLFDDQNVLLLNNEVKDFYRVEKYLNKKNANSNICVINSNNRKICESNGKYLVEPTYFINNSNMSSIITEIDSGDIIKIDNLSMTNFIILINKIKYRNLNISYLNDLISENYSSL